MRHSAILVFLFLTSPFFLPPCGATRLPPQWCVQIMQLCNDFSDAHPTPPAVIQVHCLQSPQESLRSTILFLFLPVILWSPLEQFSNILPDVKCPKCIALGLNGVSLCATGWRNGAEGERSEPRKVYGIDGVTLLVGRVYKCSKGHEVLGYSPEILRKIPDYFIPFQLWHITGFTRGFIEMTVSLITAGLSISGIRTFFQKRQNTWYYSQMQLYKGMLSSDDQAAYESFPSLSTWKNCFSTFIPSTHALSGCFLADFWSEDSVYTECMKNISVDDNGGSWLSLDHTFSSASEFLCKRDNIIIHLQ